MKAENFSVGVLPGLARHTAVAQAEARLGRMHPYRTSFDSDEIRRFPCNRYRKKWHDSSLIE